MKNYSVLSWFKFNRFLKEQNFDIKIFYLTIGNIQIIWKNIFDLKIKKISIQINMAKSKGTRLIITLECTECRKN